MLLPFFIQAAVSPSRQRVLRLAVLAHVLALAWSAVRLFNTATDREAVHTAATLGYLLLTAGMVEGALLIGWRLSQLPKSQALEFLLVTPLRAPGLVFGEALVGLTRLALVTLSGLPLLVLLYAAGKLELVDLLLLLTLPWTWGTLVGLLLTAWAYESALVRRWVERVLIAGLLLYLVVGVLAGENLIQWLACLPEGGSRWVLLVLRCFHEYNPFGIFHGWFLRPWAEKWGAAALGEGVALAVGGLLLGRCACRLRHHFQDRHYRPAVDLGKVLRSPVGEHPLTWWAVRRVGEYSGRINLWLAGGFCLLYAAYTVAGSAWPPWLGRQVFTLVEGVGGIPALAAGLVMLAAVPAAFQYGLWDNTAQDRGRRLELLLLTQLDGPDYWRAAASAAWQRGRGYFFFACLLWVAALVAGQLTLGMAFATAAAAVVVWGCCFALGFRDFARGRNAHTLGLFLTLGLPLLTILAYRLDWTTLGSWLPPGCLYAVARDAPNAPWLCGILTLGGLTLVVSRNALAHCETTLRWWYDHHGGSG